MRPQHGFLMRDSWRPDIVFSRRLEFDGGYHAPARVRAAVNALLGDRLDPLTLLDADVLISELVTNAVRHGGADPGTTIVVHVALAPDVLRIEVCDQGPGFTPPRSPRARAEGGGHGLVLLARMSSRWGVAVDDGTCVWFERRLSVAT